MRKTALLLASTTIAVLVVCATAWADTFTVTNTNSSGPGSLRAAITKANSNSGRDVVSFAPGVRGTIGLESALPQLGGELEIRGPGAGQLTVRRAAAQEFRIFYVLEGSSVRISGLTISNGSSTFGGGISNDGELRLSGVYVSENSTDWCGGGMYNGGQATVERSTFSDNFADSCGGGIVNFGRLTVVGSTFFGNTAAGGGVKGGGGGIHNDRILRVENGTFVGNRAGDETTRTGLGGGIQNHKSDSTLVGSTFFDNTAGQAGGGIHNGAGPSTEVFLQMSIIAGNEAGRYSPDIGGNSFTSRGYNLIGDPGGTTSLTTTDLTGTAPRFDPRGLRNYGGPTRTMALTRNSPAVDAVRRLDACTLAEDQRGVMRPQDGDGNGTARCDIGAYERRTPSTQ